MAINAEYLKSIKFSSRLIIHLDSNAKVSTNKNLYTEFFSP